MKSASLNVQAVLLDNGNLVLRDGQISKLWKFRLSMTYMDAWVKLGPTNVLKINNS